MNGSAPPVDPHRERLRAAGLRVTAPRVAVLDLLVAVARPVTHAEVVERLVGGGWDRATLYRNLTDLAEAGVLVRTDLGDHLWRYELADGDAAHTSRHPHFVCTSCGDVACLPELVPPAAWAAAPVAVRAGAVEIQVRGVCDRCGDAPAP